MKWLAPLLVFLAGCAGCASIPEPRHEYAAAVRLDFYTGGNCSGTAVAEYTILSAAHCFEGSDMGGMLIDGQSVAYQVIANDGSDHVLLRVTARQHPVAKVRVAGPQWGETVALIGNPAGLSNLLRVGRVAGFNAFMPCLRGATKCDGFYLDLNTTGGDSGAGYFNHKGEVVGVHSGSFSWGIWKLAFSYRLNFTPEQWKAAGV